MGERTARNFRARDKIATPVDRPIRARNPQARDFDVI